MTLHLLGAIAVLLFLVAISAYRDALKNEPIGRFGTQPDKLPRFDELE